MPKTNLLKEAHSGSNMTEKFTPNITGVPLDYPQNRLENKFVTKLDTAD